MIRLNVFCVIVAALVAVLGCAPAWASDTPTSEQCAQLGSITVLCEPCTPFEGYETIKYPMPEKDMTPSANLGCVRHKNKVLDKCTQHFRYFYGRLEKDNEYYYVKASWKYVIAGNEWNNSADRCKK